MKRVTITMLVSDDELKNFRGDPIYCSVHDSTLGSGTLSSSVSNFQVEDLETAFDAINRSFHFDGGWHADGMPVEHGEEFGETLAELEDDMLVLTKGDRMLEVVVNSDGELDFTAWFNHDGDWDHVHNYDSPDFLDHPDSDETIRETGEF